MTAPISESGSSLRLWSGSPRQSVKYSWSPATSSPIAARSLRKYAAPWTRVSTLLPTLHAKPPGRRRSSALKSLPRSELVRNQLSGPSAGACWGCIGMKDNDHPRSTPQRAGAGTRGLLLPLFPPADHPHRQVCPRVKTARAAGRNAHRDDGEDEVDPFLHTTRCLEAEGRPAGRGLRCR